MFFGNFYGIIGCAAFADVLVVSGIQRAVFISRDACATSIALPGRKKYFFVVSLYRERH